MVNLAVLRESLAKADSLIAETAKNLDKARQILVGLDQGVAAIQGNGVAKEPKPRQKRMPELEVLTQFTEIKSVMPKKRGRKPKQVVIAADGEDGEEVIGVGA